MPHQCLQCGNTFAEGSKELLRGCPGCGGTRFFFTQAPLAGSALQEKREEAKQDIRAVVQALLAETGSPQEAVRRLQEEGIARSAPTPSASVPPAVQGSLATVVAAPAASATVSPAAAAPAAPGPAAANAPPAPKAVRAETVTIAQAGQYEIDVEGLLNANPIVIQKDGVYMIHLPSVFDTNGKRRTK